MFHKYVASVLSGCCVYLQWFQVFLQEFQTHILSVSSVFMRMLQVLHLDVLKVDRMLHLPPCFFVASHRCLFLGAGWASTAPPPLSRCW